MIDDNLICRFQILDDGENVFDHLPLTIDATVSFSNKTEAESLIESSPMLKWSKCSEMQREKYQNMLADLISKSSAKSVSQQCRSGCHCKNLYAYM